MKRLCCVKLSGSVDSAFHSASRISMYLGVFPYAIKSGKLQASKLYLFWSTLLMLSVTGLQILIFIDPPIEENERFMSKFLTYLQLGSLSITLIINLAWLHNSKEKLNSALILLNKVNNRLATAEMNVSLIAPFTGLLLITVLAGAGAFLKVEGRIKFILLYVTYYITSVMIYAVALQLSGTLALTKHFFKELHIRLPKPRTVGHQTSIDVLIESHETIVTACEAVNQAYAPQLLLIILTSFVLVTGNSYSVLISDVSEATITVFWVILFAHLAWHIISACDGTYTEVSYICIYLIYFT
ncbi:hypothetical protein O3M35_012442 [Rhynocoris fuscipes]|uniref:Gustatory receptor n=1 Tax=Rhynocoris fuscipes TaxID=488301 RepID=A0AAW1CSC3_9HEMI